MALELSLDQLRQFVRTQMENNRPSPELPADARIGDLLRWDGISWIPSSQLPLIATDVPIHHTSHEYGGIDEVSLQLLKSGLTAGTIPYVSATAGKLTSSTSLTWDDALGSLCILGMASDRPADNRLYLANETGSIGLGAFEMASASGGSFGFFRSRNTLAARNRARSGDSLGNLTWRGSYGATDGAASVYSASANALFRIVANQSFTDTNMGTRFEVLLSKDSTATAGVPVTYIALKITDKGVVLTPAGLGSTQVAHGGRLPGLPNVTKVGNVGAGEDDLMTYSVAASMLATDRDSLEFHLGGTWGSSLNNRVLRIYFAGIKIYDSGTLGATTGVESWEAHVEIIRLSSTTFQSIVRVTSSYGAPIAVKTNPTNTVAGGGNFGSAQTFKATGEATANDDITQEGLVGWWYPAN